MIEVQFVFIHLQGALFLSVLLFAYFDRNLVQSSPSPEPKSDFMTRTRVFQS